MDRLAGHTHVEEERITKAFYVFYRDLRLDLFYQLRRDNSPPKGMDTELHEVRLLEHAQKIRHYWKLKALNRLQNGLLA